jgi:RimJ/RimL family protein N-acetyltransferase
MLAGDVIALRAWCEDDLEPLALLRNNVALQSMLITQPRPNSAEKVRRWLIDKTGREDILFFIVAQCSSQQCIGYIQLSNMRLLHGTADLGICLAPAAQGQGAGREAMALLERYAQQVFALRKIVLQVLVDNHSAVAFYGRLGFSEVGRLREHAYVDGLYRDVLIMEKRLAP